MPCEQRRAPTAIKRPRQDAIAENSCCPHLDRIHLMRIVGNPRNFAIADFGFGPWVVRWGAVVALRQAAMSRAPTGLEWQRAFKSSIRAILESSLMV